MAMVFCTMAMVLCIMAMVLHHGHGFVHHGHGFVHHGHGFLHHSHGFVYHGHGFVHHGHGFVCIDPENSAEMSPGDVQQERVQGLGSRSAAEAFPALSRGHPSQSGLQLPLPGGGVQIHHVQRTVLHALHAHQEHPRGVSEEFGAELGKKKGKKKEEKKVFSYLESPSFFQLVFFFEIINNKERNHNQSLFNG